MRLNPKTRTRRNGVEEKKLRKEEEEEVEFRRRIRVEEICIGRGGHGRRCNAGRPGLWMGVEGEP